jgi:hypothetical protein
MNSCGIRDDACGGMNGMTKTGWLDGPIRGIGWMQRMVGLTDRLMCQE